MEGVLNFSGFSFRIDRLIFRMPLIPRLIEELKIPLLVKDQTKEIQARRRWEAIKVRSIFISCKLKINFKSSLTEKDPDGKTEVSRIFI
jgi:hypothetical protein